MGDVGIMGFRLPGGDWKHTRELATLADDLGYSCITMGESWAEDAFTSLAQLGAGYVAHQNRHEHCPHIRAHSPRTWL